MRAQKVTQEGLAKTLRRDRSVISRILNGEQPLKLDEVQPLADALQVPMLEILYRAGLWGNSPQTPIREIPVISGVEAGLLTEPNADLAQGRETILTEYPKATTFGLRVQGDSMDQVAPDSSLIVIDYSIRDLRDRDLGVFRQGGEGVFKRFRKHGRDRWLEPDSSNPRHVPIFPTGEEPLEVIGAVVEIRPEYGGR